MTTVLKLGGSVITEKDRAETIDGAALDRTADAVADAISDPPDLVLVHGGGSFGHHNAEDHGVSTITGTHDAGAAMEIHGAMKTLNRFVLDRLHERDIPALPVHPFSTGARDVEGDLELPTRQVATMVEEGFVPVLHGDLIAHERKGATVVSGDELVVELGTALDAERVGLCSTVPGVLRDDTVIPRIESFDEVADVLGGSDATDVTDGMAGKVEQLLNLDVPASIFDLDNLDRFLAGESPGTTIDGE
jgi:isopentenyl phosphate kinase